MRKNTIWSLTVHFYKRQIDEGLKPIRTEMFACSQCSLAEGKLDQRSLYHAHTFQFVHPPSREEFAKLVQFLPWAAHCWEEMLLPLILDKRNEWPIITPGYKASSTDILDEQGRRVGELHVNREEVWENAGYIAPYVSIDEIKRAICRLGPRRDEAYHWLTVHENRIRERAMDLGREKDRSPEEFVRQAIREALVDSGFIKASPAKRASNRSVCNREH